jgi:hypothetical protein
MVTDMDEHKPLRLQFKKFLDEERLDDRQYASLRQKLEQSGVDRSEDPDSYPRLDKFAGTGLPAADVRRRIVWTAAAAILILITALSITRFFPWTDEGSHIHLRIAEEVATNHIKIQRPDLETSSMEEIRAYFDRLDFVPSGSDLIDRDNHILKGARYCTLQGKIAAHLIFNSPQGMLVSHYQAAYESARFGKLPHIEKNEAPRIITSRGVEVHIWVERDLLMARAHTIQNSQGGTHFNRISYRPEL